MENHPLTPVKKNLCYNKLWKMMIDRHMLKKDLQNSIGVSRATMARMANDKAVSADILLKICEVMDCNFSDIIEAVPESRARNEK